MTKPGNSRLILSGAMIILLAACASGPQPPEADSSYAVGIADNVVLDDERLGVPLTVRVVYPQGEGVFPVIVYSHGAFCFPQMYDNITRQWAEQGYVVILPNHLDSPAATPGGPTPEMIAAILDTRIEDMSTVLDSLEQLESSIPALYGRLDRERAVAAGHSFGGMITMIMAGLRMDNGAGGSINRGDVRFKVAVVMSGVGPMEQMAADAFDGLTGPLIATGGTLDVGNVGTGEIYPWQWRMSAYRLAPPGDKYELVMDQADHYLGGLICRAERGGDDDRESVDVVGQVTLQFLDAYVKGDPEARAFLVPADVESLSDRAAFQRK